MSNIKIREYKQIPTAFLQEGNTTENLKREKTKVDMLKKKFSIFDSYHKEKSILINLTGLKITLLYFNNELKQSYSTLFNKCEYY